MLISETGAKSRSQATRRSDGCALEILNRNDRHVTTVQRHDHRKLGLARGRESADHQLVEAHLFLRSFDGESAVQAFAQT
jgi:hypothetical protein